MFEFSLFTSKLVVGIFKYVVTFVFDPSADNGVTLPAHTLTVEDSLVQGQEHLKHAAQEQY